MHDAKRSDNLGSKIALLQIDEAKTGIHGSIFKDVIKVDI